MAGITPFQRKVSLDPRPARDYSVPTVADVGGEIGRFGQRLLGAFEPQLQKRAEEQALAAVGSAKVVRDADGNWKVPDKPAGAGFAYAETFDRAMGQVYLGKVQTDLDEQLGALAITHRMDPEAYKAAAVGYAEGTLEHVDPRYRAQVDNYLTREVSERYRGLAGEKADRDFRQTVQSVQLQIKNNNARALKIASAGNDDAAALALDEMGKNDELYDTLKGLGVYNADGVAAAKVSDLLDAGDEIEKAEDRPIAVGIARRLNVPEGQDGSLTDQQLSYLVATATSPDVKQDPKTFGWDGMPIEQLIHSKEMKQQIGRLAGDVLNKRAYDRAEAYRKAQDAARAQAEQQQLSSVQELITAVKNNNYQPAQGYTQDQVAAFEAERSSKGNAYARMQSAQGRFDELRFIGETGYVPIGVKDFIEGQIQSGNLPQIKSFVDNLRKTTSGPAKYAVGEIFYKTLSENTRQAIQVADVAARLGMPTPNQLELVRKVANGEGILTPNEAKGQIKGFDNRKVGSLQDAFNLKGQDGSWGAIAANPMINHDFEQALPYYMLMFPGDQNRALSEAAKSVAGAYRPSEIFEGGFAPVVFERSGIGAYQINQLPQVKDTRVNPSGARVGQKTNDGRSRVLLAPLGINQQSGYGKYKVTFLAQSGRPMGVATVDLDATFAQRGIPQEPAPAKPAGPVRSAPFMLVWDKGGKLMGYRSREWINQHRGELWSGKADNTGKPIIGGK